MISPKQKKKSKNYGHSVVHGFNTVVEVQGVSLKTFVQAENQNECHAKLRVVFFFCF